MAISLPRPSDVYDLTRRAVDQAVDGAATMASAPARAFGVLDSIETLVARINGVVDRAEGLMDGADRAISRAGDLMDRADGAVSRAGKLLGRADTTIDRAGELMDRADGVLDAAQLAVEQVSVLNSAATAAIDDTAGVTTAAAALVGQAERITGRAATVVTVAERTAATAGELLAAYEPALRSGAPKVEHFVAQFTAEEVDAAVALIDQLPQLARHLTDDILPILATLDRVGPDIHALLDVTRDLKQAVAGIPGLKMLQRRGAERLGEPDSPG